MNPIPLPYRILAAALFAFALLLGAYLKGRHDANANCDARVTKIYADAQAAKDAERAKADASSTVLETKNAQAKIIYRTITQSVDRVVDRPVYLGSCLDPDGLQLANAALAGAPVAAPQPDTAVPDARAPR